MTFRGVMTNGPACVIIIIFRPTPGPAENLARIPSAPAHHMYY